jgi:hypothetical protein
MPHFSQAAVPFPITTLRRERPLDQPLPQIPMRVALAVAPTVAPVIAEMIGWDVIHSCGILGESRWAKDISAIMESIM